MEELTQAAKAAYEHFSKDQKRAVKEFFSKMDKNGDGKISLQEFVLFCWEELPAGWSRYSNFFNLLVDQNRDGTLGFDQVLTVFYLLARGWYTCNGCGVSISGLFFTCMRCHLSNKDGRSYDLCIPCYHGRKFKHKHTEFLDNQAALLKMQKMSLPPPRTQISGASGSLSETISGASGSVSGTEKFNEILHLFGTALSILIDVASLTQI